jgi:hypothetical protein
VTVKKILTCLVLVSALAGCAPAVSATGTAVSATGTAVSAAGTAATAGAHAQTARLVVWSVNSDGPRFQAILTGAVGDYGPGLTVHPNGTPDPSHGSELSLRLRHGSFRLSIGKLDAAFVHAVIHWPYDRATCSIHGTITGTVPVVPGSGTGAYRGIAGAFTVTLSLDEDWKKGPACNETSAFQAQLLLITGTGSVRV